MPKQNPVSSVSQTMKRTEVPQDGAFALLDPSRPAGLQASAVPIETAYERYMPELSGIAERVFKDVLLQLRPRQANTVSVWVPVKAVNGNIGIPQAALVDSYGTPVPGSDVQPEAKFPVRTPHMDPRLHPYKGNPDLVAVHLGRTLATHIMSEKERLEAKTGKKLILWHGNVEVLGEIPATLVDTCVNGLRLSKTAPMMYAKVFVHLREA